MHAMISERGRSREERSNPTQANAAQRDHGSESTVPPPHGNMRREAHYPRDAQNPHARSTRAMKLRKPQQNTKATVVAVCHVAVVHISRVEKERKKPKTKIAFRFPPYVPHLCLYFLFLFSLSFVSLPRSRFPFSLSAESSHRVLEVSSSEKKNVSCILGTSDYLALNLGPVDVVVNSLVNLAA